MSRLKQVNPCCPVSGCKTKAAHTTDPQVQALLSLPPATIVGWTKRCMVELIQSVIADLNAPEAGRVFAYLTRWRDLEELYHRVLYALLIAPESHLPHILSGAMPNGLSFIWGEVNRIIYEGRGTLLQGKSDLSGKSFTPIDLLNQNAHNSYFTMLMTFGLVREGGDQWKAQVRKHLVSWQSRVEYLNHIEGLFRVGRDKEVVLKAITNMHRPREAWKDVPQLGTPPVKLLRSAFLKKGAQCRYMVVDQPPNMTETEFRFRLHVGDTPHWDEKNLVLTRSGSREDLLKVFEADLEAVKKEGWIVAGASACADK